MEVESSIIKKKLFYRVLSSIILASIAVGFNFIGNIYFLILILVTSLILLFEYYNIFSYKIINLNFIITYFFIFISCVLTYLSNLTYLTFFICFFLIYIYKKKNNSFYTYLPIIYIGLPASLLLYLNKYTEEGKTAILLLFIIVWATDTFGYFVGKTFKGPKLYKKISPNKTWSGFIGSIIGAVGFSILYCYVTEYKSSHEAIFYAVLISFFCTLGDFFESFLKRINNKKDSSSWLPGHGGLLDRLDGFLFAIVMLSLLIL